MAPKRGSKKVAQVVKTTKVVEETVEVSILGTQSPEPDPALTQARTPTKVSETRAEKNTVTTKTVPIEDDEEEDAQGKATARHQLTQDAETETQEPDIPLDEPSFDKIATPPREETRPRQEDESVEPQTWPSKQAKEEEVKAHAQEKQPNKKVGMRKKGKRMRAVGEGREGYKRYLLRVLKQVHPGMAVSSKAMTVINNMMSDMFERLAGEASSLSKHSHKQTLSAREIQAAVKLVLPGELGKHAIAEGTKAVTNYVTYSDKK